MLGSNSIGSSLVGLGLAWFRLIGLSWDSWPSEYKELEMKESGRAVGAIGSQVSQQWVAFGRIYSLECPKIQFLTKPGNKGLPDEQEFQSLVKSR